MPQDDGEDWRSKLTPDLAEFVVSATAHQRVSVIIELDVPSARVSFDREAMRHGEPLRPRWIDEERFDESASPTLHSAMTDLQRIVNEPPHWISAAKAFVATVSASELRDVASLRSVKRVRINRHLR